MAAGLAAAHGLEKDVPREKKTRREKKRGEKRALKNPFPREETDDPGRPPRAGVCGGGFGGLATMGALVRTLLEFEF